MRLPKNATKAAARCHRRRLSRRRDVVGALLGHAASITVAAYAPVTWREKVEAIGRLSY